MTGQPKGLFDVSTINIVEPAQPGFPPTLLPSNILDSGDPFNVSVNFSLNWPIVDPAPDPASGFIFGIINWLVCVMAFPVTYTVTYTAEAMDSDNFFSLGVVNGALNNVGGTLQLNYGAAETSLNVAGGIPHDGVYKLIATVTMNFPGIVGYAEDVIHVSANAQIP